ncbi:MAG: 30S ribosomal protein S20 [Candidatus Gracilibacteria bacterium]
MPIIKSAKKKARQAERHYERNQATRTKVKTFMKKIQLLSKSKPEDAKKLLSEAYSVLDTAAKKNILHANNVARKKSLLARTVGGVKK